MGLALAYISHIIVIVLIIECVLEVTSQLEEETLLFESVSNTESVYRLNPFASCAGTEPELLVWIHSSAMVSHRFNMTLFLTLYGLLLQAKESTQVGYFQIWLTKPKTGLCAWKARKCIFISQIMIISIVEWRK